MKFNKLWLEKIKKKLKNKFKTLPVVCYRIIVVTKFTTVNTAESKSSFQLSTSFFSPKIPFFRFAFEQWMWLAIWKLSTFQWRIPWCRRNFIGRNSKLIGKLICCRTKEWERNFFTHSQILFLIASQSQWSFQWSFAVSYTTLPNICSENAIKYSAFVCNTPCEKFFRHRNRMENFQAACVRVFDEKESIDKKRRTS